MQKAYSFNPVDNPLRCPVCLSIFNAKQNHVTPYFLFYDGKDFATIDLCYHCAQLLLQKIQQMNPGIVPFREK